MNSRIELAHFFVEMISKVYALDAQCEVYCRMAETMSDAFNEDEKKALQIRKLLVAHGRGLARSGDLLISNPDCDNEHRNRIKDIQSKINLRNDLLVEEMVKIISENDPRPESEIEEEMNTEIEKNIFDYSLYKKTL